MKKLVALTLALTMTATLCACGQKTEPPIPSNAAPSAAAPTQGAETPAVNWPTSTVNVICPSSAGGGTDNTIRAFTDTWAQQLGQSVVVTNYDATPVAMTTCADADPDGYTLVCHQNTAICQYITGVLETNPSEDLALVAALQYMGEQALIVPADAPFNNFDEFIAYAKDHPGEVSVAIATGGPAQFLWGQVMNECGVELNMVVAANTTDKLTNISGGFIDCGQVDVANAQSYEEAGKVKVIGVLSSSGENLPAWPSHWNTLQKQGYNIGWDMRLYMWAPAGTPKEVLEAINQTLKGVMENSTVADNLSRMGARAEWYDLEESQKIFQNEFDSILKTGKALGIAAVD